MMSYIYDIFINLQARLYDFYEWNNTDEIIHVRKIPVFKIRSKQLLELKNNKVLISNNFLKKLFNRTEIFCDRSVRNMPYVCLLGDENEVVALEFDSSGRKCRSSRLLIDEELEVLEVVDNLNDDIISYEVLEKEHYSFFKTRKENKIYDYLLKQFIPNNYIKLKYLYFELFEKEEDNFERIVSDIKNELDNNWVNIYHKVYSFFRLSSQRK